jgi:ACS family pantothenate transporter-like MFS transporter
MTATVTVQTDDNGNVQVVVQQKKQSIGKRILGVLWDSLDEKSPEEHRLVRRLDSCYLIWACFYYFVMYLDSSALPHHADSGKDGVR